jgi:adenylate cyclase
MLGELVPTGGGDPIPLLKSKLLIGRRDECDITLRFPNVSSNHCEFELVDGYWMVRDLNSSNGIKVNGVRCPQNWLLPGDEISIAKHKFEIKYAAVGPAPQPMNEFDPSVSLMEKAGLSRRAVEMAHGEDISQSLMEKAGLERGPRNSRNPDKRSAPNKPTPVDPSSSSRITPPAIIKPKKPESDESIALKWLENDE